MADKKNETWPDLAINLYDKLTGRNAEITYEFDNFVLGIPRQVGSDEKAEWQFNGKLKISTNESKA